MKIESKKGVYREKIGLLILGWKYTACEKRVTSLLDSYKSLSILYRIMLPNDDQQNSSLNMTVLRMFILIGKSANGHLSIKWTQDCLEKINFYFYISFPVAHFYVDVGTIC